MEKDIAGTGIKKPPIRVRPSPTYVATLAVIGGLMVLLILVTSGILPVEDWYLNWVGFIDQVITISMLAVLGAVFLGMLISYRMLTKSSFTPFEHSMLEMADDVKLLKEQLDALEARIEAIDQGDDE